MVALAGSAKKLVVKTKRGGHRGPVTVRFAVLQACQPGWTLDKFQLVVQGIEDFQFVVGDFTTKRQSVSQLSSTKTLFSIEFLFRKQSGFSVP